MMMTKIEEKKLLRYYYKDFNFSKRSFLNPSYREATSQVLEKRSEELTLRQCIEMPCATTRYLVSEL